MRSMSDVSPVARSLRALRERAGLSRARLAERLGMPEQTYVHYEMRYKRPHLPMELTLRLADVLAAHRIARPDVLALAGVATEPSGSAPAPAMMASDEAAREVDMGGVRTDPLVGAADFPIFASARGGPDGAWVVGQEPIEFGRRPEPLLRVRDGFGVYVLGESMAPAYKQGDLVLVHPHRPVSRGDDVILVSVDPTDNEQHAVIKELVDWDEGNWLLRQHNPAGTLALPRATWQRAMLIVGKYNARR